MVEMIDIFDENYTYIGCAEKSVAHKFGLWHQTFQCWIIRRRDNNNYILFQKRANQKKDSPGLFDISAAGHLQAGEKKEDGVRELEEEIGIKCDNNSLRYLGVRIAAYRFKDLINKEFCHVFLLEDERKIDAYILEKDEVTGLLELDIKDAISLFSNQRKVVKGSYFESGRGLIRTVSVDISKFVPRIDSYYLKVCLLASSYFEGDTKLFI